MGSLLITNAHIFTGEKFIDNHSILIENGRIQSILPSNVNVTANTVWNAEGNKIAPGFIDLQIYGGGGFLFSNNPSAEALHAMTESIVRSGTSQFLVTLATNSIDVFEKAIDIVKNNPNPAVLGLHFEGPYINPAKKGAHLEHYIKYPQKEEIECLLNKADGVLKMVTLAPEICKKDIIEIFNKQNVIVSAGHSNAGFKEAQEGFESGITAVTHLFNAMSPFHHRDTGLPGATFLNQEVMASIIADGIHVDFNTLAISKKIMKERLFLITDAVEENREGDYVHLASTDRFTLPDGTLSGSRLSMLQAVKNCIQFAKISIEEALRMASTYPAKLAGLKDQGFLKSNFRANMVVFDNDFSVRATFVQGKMYDAKS